MAIQPSPAPEYRPPTKVEEVEFPVDLGDLQLVVRQSIYRDKIVDFALMLDLVDSTGEVRVNICRVDCCHGTVHRHDFRKDKSKERDETTKLHVIDARPEMHPWDQIDKQFLIQYDAMVDQYQELYRRWAQ